MCHSHLDARSINHWSHKSSANFLYSFPTFSISPCISLKPLLATAQHTSPTLCLTKNWNPYWLTFKDVQRISQSSLHLPQSMTSLHALFSGISVTNSLLFTHPRTSPARGTAPVYMCSSEAVLSDAACWGVLRQKVWKSKNRRRGAEFCGTWLSGTRCQERHTTSAGWRRRTTVRVAYIWTLLI